MQTIDIQEAKTHLSRLVEKVVDGQPFVIANAGKPLVKVVPLNKLEEAQSSVLGSWLGKFRCRMTLIRWAGCLANKLALFVHGLAL